LALKKNKADIIEKLEELLRLENLTNLNETLSKQLIIHNEDIVIKKQKI
jgi:hypothetical protein